MKILGGLARMSVYDKEQIFLFPGERLYGAIHEAAEENGYTFHPTEEIEIEYYGSKSCYAYCAVEKK